MDQYIELAVKYLTTWKSVAILNPIFTAGLATLCLFIGGEFVSLFKGRSISKLKRDLLQQIGLVEESSKKQEVLEISQTKSHEEISELKQQSEQLTTNLKERDDNIVGLKESEGKLTSTLDKSKAEVDTLKVSLSEKTQHSEKLGVELQEQKDKVSLHAAKEEKLVELEKKIYESTAEISTVKQQVIQLKAEVNDKDIQIESLNSKNLSSDKTKSSAELDQHLKKLSEKVPEPVVDQQPAETPTPSSPLKTESKPVVVAAPEVKKIEETKVEPVSVPEKKVVIDKPVKPPVEAAKPKANESFKPLVDRISEDISPKDDKDSGLLGKASSLFGSIGNKSKKEESTKEKPVAKEKSKSMWKSIKKLSKSSDEKKAKPASTKKKATKVEPSDDKAVPEKITQPTPEKSVPETVVDDEGSNDIAESIDYIKGKFKSLFKKKG